MCDTCVFPYLSGFVPFFIVQSWAYVTIYNKLLSLEGPHGPCSWGQTNWKPFLKLIHWTNRAVDWVQVALLALWYISESCHFRAYSFLVEGALGLRIVSITLVESLESMSWYPSGARPKVSRWDLDWGGIIPCTWDRISPWTESPLECYLGDI